MKNLTKVLAVLIVTSSIGATSCRSGSEMTGKEKVKSDQEYHNYDAAMKRLDDEEKKSKKKKNE